MQANPQQPSGLIRPSQQLMTPMQSPMAQGVSPPPHLGLMRPPMVQNNLQQLGGQIRPLPMPNNPQQLQGPMRPVLQGNPQQPRGPMRPPLQSNLQQQGGPMRPPLLQGNPHQPRGSVRPPMQNNLQQQGGPIRPSLLQGSFQQPRGQIRPPPLQGNLQQQGGPNGPPIIQGMNQPQQLGGVTKPSIMLGNPKQSSGSMNPLMMQGVNGLQQTGGTIARPPMMQRNLQQPGGSMRPPMMPNNLQQTQGFITPPTIQGMNQPQLSMVQNNLQQQEGSMRPTINTPQHPGGFMGQPMMQGMRPQMPIGPPSFPMGPRQPSFGVPQLLHPQPNAMEGYQQNQNYSVPRQNQQHDPDQEELNEDSLLEPLSSYDTAGSNIQLNYTQLFSFHVSYNNLSPNGQPQRGSWFKIGRKTGEWKTCILEVDFLSHLFRLQHSDRVVNSKPFFAWQNRNLGYQSDDMLRSPLVIMWFSTEQWQLVTQNREEKRCLAHVLECVGDNLRAEDCVSSVDPTIVGLGYLYKYGKLQGVNKLPDNMYILSQVCLKQVFVAQMVQGLEFEIMIPGIKSINLIAPHVEEMTEWMGAIGRSVDIAKEKIASKRFVKMEPDEEEYDRNPYYHDDNEYYYHDNIDIENCDEDLEEDECEEDVEGPKPTAHHKKPTRKFQSSKRYQSHFSVDDHSESDDDHKEKKRYKKSYNMKHAIDPRKYYRIKEPQPKFEPRYEPKYEPKQELSLEPRHESRQALAYEPRYENIDEHHHVRLPVPHDNTLCDKSGGGGIVQLFIENGGCSGKNMNNSQTMNKYQPYARSTPKFPKFPKFSELKKKIKTSCHSKDKKQKNESSSSSENEGCYNPKKALKQKWCDTLNYNTSSESEVDYKEKHNIKKLSYPKYHKLKQVVSQVGKRKKFKQQRDIDHDSIGDSKAFHHNEIQLRNGRDCCRPIRNECAQCDYPRVNKDCCNSTRSDCTSCSCIQHEAINNLKTRYNDDSSCCEYNESYDRNNHSPHIGSTINHYRSNSLLTNSHLPRRYPASWTPLQGRSCLPPERVVRPACTILECDDHDGSTDEFYEGNCNVIRGGVAQRSTPSCSQTSDSESLCTDLNDLKINENEDDVQPSYLQQGWQEHKNERGHRFYYHPSSKRFSLVPPSVQHALINFDPSNDVDINC